MLWVSGLQSQEGWMNSGLSSPWFSAPQTALPDALVTECAGMDPVVAPILPRLGTLVPSGSPVSYPAGYPEELPSDSQGDRPVTSAGSIESTVAVDLQPSSVILL